MYSIVHWTVFKGHIPFVVTIKRWLYSPCVPVLAFNSPPRFGRWGSCSSRAGSPQLCSSPEAPRGPWAPLHGVLGASASLPWTPRAPCVWSPSSWLCSSNKLSEKWRVACECFESLHAGKCTYSGSHVMHDVLGLEATFLQDFQVLISPREWPLQNPTLLTR